MSNTQRMQAVYDVDGSPVTVPKRVRAKVDDGFIVLSITRYSGIAGTMAGVFLVSTTYAFQHIWPPPIYAWFIGIPAGVFIGIMHGIYYGTLLFGEIAYNTEQIPLMIPVEDVPEVSTILINGEEKAAQRHTLTYTDNGQAVELLPAEQESILAYARENASGLTRGGAGMTSQKYAAFTKAWEGRGLLVRHGNNITLTDAGIDVLNY